MLKISLLIVKHYFNIEILAFKCLIMDLQIGKYQIRRN